MRHTLMQTLVYVVIFGLLAAAGYWWFLPRIEQAMTYHPTGPVQGGMAGEGLPIEEVRITTQDGETLHGWWLPQQNPAAPLLLFFHGNAGNRGDRLHNLAGLWRNGYQVLIPDYRGYGGSSGIPSEQGLALDADAAYDWLLKQGGGRPIHAFGRSLGGAVAAGLALRRPLRALLLESTFTSAKEMAGRMMPIPGIGGLIRSRYETLAAVSQLSTPLLVIHGESDSLVPFSMGQKLFAAAQGQPKVFHPVPGGSHNDTYLVAGNAYYSWINDFLDGLR